MLKYILVLITFSLQLTGTVENSILPKMETAYVQHLTGDDHRLREWSQYINQIGPCKIRLMTYNMLYNMQNAEDKLPLKHRWPYRKARLIEYIVHTNSDIICSQELQESQVEELMNCIGDKYNVYGLKTRMDEGRSDTNAIFFNPLRFNLLNAQTVPYNDPKGNAFTYCYFEDKFTNKKFSVINTKLSWGVTWGAIKKRYAEAVQLCRFTRCLPTNEPIILMGDFNILRFFDDKSIVKLFQDNNLSDAKTRSIFGHFGPFCSITNSSIFLTPFTGPELKGFILDRIFVNDCVWTLVHAIDTAKVDGEFPSDHFPVIAEVIFNP